MFSLAVGVVKLKLKRKLNPYLRFKFAD